MSAPTPGRDMPAIPTSPFIPPAETKPRRTEPSPFRRVPLRPAEGWITVILTILLVLPIAWSIADARYILGRGDLTAFLPLAALLGTSWGILGAKLGWGRWRTHGLGALFAALAVPILVGMTLVTAENLAVTASIPGGDIGGYFRATADSTVNAFLDLAVLQKSVTEEYGHYMLVLGLVVWGTGQFAGYATFGHRRPLGAVFVTGLVLLTNMAITNNDQLTLLVLYSLAALLLLVRLHADEERLSWLHRRIGDPAAVTGLYLRGGSTFVAIAVVGALVLTTTAASAPLASAFTGLDQQLVDIGQQFERFLPVGGPGTRIAGVAFGSTAQISGKWNNDNTEALLIHVPPGDTTQYYWRAVAYDKFSAGNVWSVSDGVGTPRPAGQSVLDGTGDAIQATAERRPLDFSVDNIKWAPSTIFTPSDPATVSIDTTVNLVGPQHYFGSLEADGWKSYTATALVPKEDDPTGATGFTQNQLRAAGQNYPAAIRELYLAPPPDGTLGPESLALLAEINGDVAKAGLQADPFDIATTMRDVLRDPSGPFHYNTDVTSLVQGPCKDLSTVECFATYKQGYCQYFATTMALLLRKDGIPARFVQGWLPGTRDVATGTEPILRSNSHAWVEVYFPGYGWFMFDPTKTGLTIPPPLPVGPKVSPKPSASARPRSSGDAGPDKTIRPPAGAGTTTTPPAGPSPAGLIVIGVLLLISVGGMAFLAYRRGPQGPTHPETAWRGVVGLASRFGWAPRPTQTPYEYAGTLSEVIPVARPDLYTVATARVEVVYGRHTLDHDRLVRVRLAQRRLRITLLRLIFRRPARPRIRVR
jgi:transglutaminase-like putative cysteine protease